MAHEPEEVIKQQMLETRASLTEKLETLEQQVVGTVHSATSAVTDTVETVKSAVQETVQMAKTSVQDTVEAVKETFDLPRQVREHPWLMVGGSVAVGYAGGWLLHHAESAAQKGEPRAGLNFRSPGARPEFERDGGVSRRPEDTAPSMAAAPASRSYLGELGQRFEGELTKLKGLALGTVFGVVRDMIASAAPPQVSTQLADIVDSATVKLGGQPIHGPVLNMFQQGGAGRNEADWQTSSRAGQRPGGTANSPQPRATGVVD